MVDGNQIRAFREAKGWSLYEFGQRTGIHHLFLARIEKGTAKHMTPAQEATLLSAIEGRDFRPLPGSPTDGRESPILNQRSVMDGPSPRLPSSFVPIPIMAPSLDMAADLLAAHVTSCDPTWGSRLEIMKSERGFSTLQAITTCVAYVLEQSLHMMIVKHDTLEPSPWKRGDKMECPQCHVEYSPGYPGQPYCGNQCAEESRKVLAG